MPLESYCYTRISIGAPHPHKELHVAPLTVRAERELTLADPLMDIRLPPLIMAVRIQSLCLYSTAAADVSVRHFFITIRLLFREINMRCARPSNKPLLSAKLRLTTSI